VENSSPPFIGEAKRTEINYQNSFLKERGLFTTAHNMDIYVLGEGSGSDKKFGETLLFGERETSYESIK